MKAALQPEGLKLATKKLVPRLRQQEMSAPVRQSKGKPLPPPEEMGREGGREWVDSQLQCLEELVVLGVGPALARLGDGGRRRRAGTARRRRSGLGLRDAAGWGRSPVAVAVAAWGRSPVAAAQAAGIARPLGARGSSQARAGMWPGRRLGCGLCARKREERRREVREARGERAAWEREPGRRRRLGTRGRVRLGQREERRLLPDEP
jgi:hypothetical protein